MEYEIITVIKESDKGSVYLASVEVYAYPVVVKELKHGNVDVFNALKNIDNIHLPKILHVEKSEKGLLVVEEYIEGETLAWYLKKAEYTVEKYLNIAEQLCEALMILHGHTPPLIHRDVKPSNIIINAEGVLKLIDFDSSRYYKEDSDNDTRLLGTEKYAAPEQYGFAQTDCRSDIYSMGVVLGMFPKFPDKVTAQRFSKLVEKCTLFAPDSRFQHVEEVLEQIRSIKGKRAGKLRKYLAMVGVFAILGTVVIFLQVFNRTPKEDEQQPADIAQTDTILQPESYRTTAPVWRDMEDDTAAIKELKEYIRNNHLVVLYCFKDRLLNDDYLLHVRDLERQNTQLLGVNIYSYENAAEKTIDEAYISFKDNVIGISGEYMKSMPEGYYSINVSMNIGYNNDEKRQLSVFLYIAETDIYEGSFYWLQNTTLAFYGEENATVKVVVQNDSLNEIVGLKNEKGEEIDPSLYRILRNGRVLEFSHQLLMDNYDKDQAVFYVMGKDGTANVVQIDNSHKTV